MKTILNNSAQPTLAFIKILARKAKKKHGFGQRQALEHVSQEYGYQNWKDCQRALSETPPTSSTTPPVTLSTIEITFTEWLKRHKNRNSPLGDLASDMLRDESWPERDNVDAYISHLGIRRASWRAIETLQAAWKSYRRYLKAKASPTPIKKSTVKPKDPNRDHRKITFVKNAPPIHYTKRTVEMFKPGDKAWVSFDGSKAIPVTITEVDERYYTFRKERPLKNAGDEHYLLHDEVRSTPELACSNSVA